ncbi:MAG: hypothetical protein V1644_02620 [Candidatus Micrarchaeota archaeon]
MKIVLYVDSSQASQEARNFLKAQSVDFEEVDVETPEGNAQFLKRIRFGKAPVFEFKRNHSILVIAGLNKAVLFQELQSAKTPQRKLEV